MVLTLIQQFQDTDRVIAKQAEKEKPSGVRTEFQVKVKEIEPGLSKPF